MTVDTHGTVAFPGQEWESVSPAQAGLDAARLAGAEQWLIDRCGDRPFRAVVVRGGRIVAEWSRELDPTARIPIASAAKSMYSNVLGILVDEGLPGSPDDLVVDYFPEMMDVKEGQGNKPGRYAFEVNRGITFRHLICNVSGYMKPGEAPGKVFNYQSWGMNILTHALAQAYGLYDVADPEGSLGFGELIRTRLAEPIGAQWRYQMPKPAYNDRLCEGARIDVFGYYTVVNTTARDLARLGWLWCNWGKWGDRQVVPEKWMRETTVTAPDILANCPEDEWKYGHGIWTNDHGKLWPGLPHEGFSAQGAGGHHCCVFPSRELVVVQNPGPSLGGDAAADATREFLALVLDACTD